jgi:hypothetical protein
MKHGLRIVCITLISLVFSLFISLPALAFPQLPSSFFGTVKVNASNVPDGTSVQALIGGKVYAETLTQTYQGDSVYALDVTGDDTDSTVQDGGREGDTIQFKIGGVVASQTGVFHSGTNVDFALTATTATPIATPRATLTHAPTQTTLPTLKPTQPPATLTPSLPNATSPIQSSPVPDTTGEVSLTQTSLAQSSLVATQPAQSLPVATRQREATPTSAGSEKKPGTGSGIITTVAVVVMVVLVLVMIVGYFFFANREKKI